MSDEDAVCRESLSNIVATACINKVIAFQAVIYMLDLMSEFLLYKSATQR